MRIGAGGLAAARGASELLLELATQRADRRLVGDGLLELIRPARWRLVAEHANEHRCEPTSGRVGARRRCGRRGGRRGRRGAQTETQASVPAHRRARVVRASGFIAVMFPPRADAEYARLPL